MTYDDYRLTLVGLDAAAIALVLGAAAAQDDPLIGMLALSGVGTYALGAPIVHLAHGQPGRSLLSVALRVGVPGLGIAIMTTSVDSCASCAGGAVFGGMVVLGGIVTAIIVDDAYLGKVPKPVPQTERRSTSSLRFGVTPIVGPKAKTLGLSLLGSF